MRPLFMICAGILSIAASANAAEKSYSPLSADMIEALVSDKTIKGEYRYMRARTKTYNFSEKHFANGTTQYKEGPVKADGVWYTLGERKICYKYPDSPEMGGSVSCFWVYNDDGCYYGYGLAEMTLKGPRSFDDWSARWVVIGSGRSCDAPIS